MHGSAAKIVVRPSELLPGSKALLVHRAPSFALRSRFWAYPARVRANRSGLGERSSAESAAAQQLVPERPLRLSERNGEPVPVRPQPLVLASLLAHNPSRLLE